MYLSSFLCRARVSYIDYEGRSDGDSIKKIINQMKPRQLVIVHGSPEVSLDLAESCRAFSKDLKVYTPKLQETIDATSETHIYQVSCIVWFCKYIFLFDLTMHLEKALTCCLAVSWPHCPTRFCTSRSYFASYSS